MREMEPPSSRRCAQPLPVHISHCEKFENEQGQVGSSQSIRIRPIKAMVVNQAQPEFRPNPTELNRMKPNRGRSTLVARVVSARKFFARKEFAHPAFQPRSGPIGCADETF